MISKQEVETAAGQAEALVANVSREHRSLAFAVVMEILLHGQGSAPALRKGRGKPPASHVREESEERIGLLDRILGTPLDLSQYKDLIDKGTWAKRSMVILWAVEQMFQIDELSAADLGAVMRKQLRLPHVYESNVNRDLRAARDLFLRSKHGRTYRYSLSASARAMMESRQVRGAGRGHER